LSSIEKAAYTNNYQWIVQIEKVLSAERSLESANNYMYDAPPQVSVDIASIDDILCIKIVRKT